MKRFLDLPYIRRPLSTALGASFAINLLTLVSPLYLTQLYDRVIPSRSGITLIAITGITLVAIALTALLEMLRGLVFARAGAALYAEMEADVLAVSRKAALAGMPGRRARAFEDLEQVRGFVTGPIPAAIIDLFFVPLFVIVLFIVHVWIGVLSIACAVALMIAAWASRRAMARTADEMVARQRQAGDALEAHLASAESATAMGYAGRAEGRAADLNRLALTAQITATVSTSGVASVVRGIRSASQTLILGLATWLAVEGSVSMGSIIACSIVFSKALGPVDQILASWRQVFTVQSAWRRLTELGDQSSPPVSLRLPAPKGAVSFENVIAMAPGGNVPILKGVTFALQAGESVGIIGPSGSGKSTLAKLMVGAWPASRGGVRIDGAEINQYDPEELGRHIGYLPQAVTLLPGTVADNIGRLNERDDQAIVAAARAANAHEMILGLPKGYDTPVAAPGFGLSGGQRQRIGLARALYGDPMLVVLDEPETGLDGEGEAALKAAILEVRRRGATLAVIAHRPALVHALDRILVLKGGAVARFGAANEILPQLLPNVGASARA
ncbi:MAG: prtD [Sphingomonas bacterium]|uniref:type I secretion system permease/ATPase n=1 Tax=Sphingomonas bacterium TaxID=1895847 RepID=UPI002621102D|nr:type I secretion system permease/ATPase [Sphingomonas bacterium]MDB5707383.1 prtD [Sphingomonas bacterium]